MKKIFFALVVFSTFALVGCGGGGGSSADDGNPSGLNLPNSISVSK